MRTGLNPDAEAEFVLFMKQRCRSARSSSTATVAGSILDQN
jgi:hypothetical protein